MRRVLRKGALAALFLCIALLFAACTVIEYRITFSLGEHAAQEAVVPETEVRTLGRSFRLPEAPAAEPPVVARRFEGRADGADTLGRGDVVVRTDATTNLYLMPGSTYHVVDALITNFHVPRSTLMMLVSAFATREQVMDAYAAAVRERYRFFSFGDAMLIE